MALWKPFRGNRADLDAVEKHDGYIYFCTDDATLFFDYLDENGELQRKQINAKEAEELAGGSITENNLVISNENCEYTVNDLKNEYLIYGPPQEDGTRLPAAGVIYSLYGSADNAEDINEYGTGDNIIVDGKSSFAVGRNIKILRDTENNSKPNYSAAFGAHHNMYGYGSVAFGSDSTVYSNSQYSFTAGRQVSNYGSKAIIAGESTNKFDNIINKRTDVNSMKDITSEQMLTIFKEAGNGKETALAYGDYSTNFGQNNITYGENSVALGVQNFTGENSSIALGHDNEVLGEYAVGLGTGHKIKGEGAVAAGYHNIIDENGYDPIGAFTVGMNNLVTGGYAFAGGVKSQATRYGSFALGYGIKTDNYNAMFVGRLNDNTDSSIIFGVGNGTGDVSNISLSEDAKSFKDGEGILRKNAFTVHSDGHAEVGAMGSTDNTIVTKKYADDNSAELKRYVDAQTTVETSFLINDNIITLENLDPSGTTINAKINYIASQNDVFQNGTFENETVPKEWAQIVEAISDDPWDVHLEDGINKVGRIGAIDATSAQYIIKYYKGKMNIEIGRTYILEMKISGKIGISLGSSQGIGEGSGWTIFDSSGDNWKTIRKQFTCVGRADGSAENVGWTMGFGLPKGETTNGAFIDDVKIYPLCEVKFQEEESIGYQTVYFADPDNGSLPTFETTSKSVTIYTFDNNDSLGVDLVIRGSYTKSLKSTLENVETQLTNIDAADIAYDGTGDFMGDSTSVEEALKNVSNNFVYVDMRFRDKADAVHEHESDGVNYMHPIEDNEYGQPQYVHSVSQALDYLFDKQESGGSRDATDASQISYDGSKQFIGGTTVKEALDNASNAIIGMQSSIPDARTIVGDINNGNTDHINSNRISYQRTNSADVYTATTAFDYLFENINNSSSGVATNAADITYNGSTQYIGGTNVEEALNNASHKILQNSMDIDNKADLGHRQGAGTIDYSHAIEDNEYGQSQYVLSVSQALDYLFDKQESGGSSGVTDASQIVYNDTPLNTHLDKLDYDLTHLTAYNVAYHYSFEEGKGVQFTHVNGALDWLCNQYENLDTALDRIIAIQENLIGGNS